MTVFAKRDLVTLAVAPSQTETEKSARTHKAIRTHLESDPELNKYFIDTFLQGSYKNSTNVRGDSDVDMGSLTNKVFYYETDWLPTEQITRNGLIQPSLKESVEMELKALPPGQFGYKEFRADILTSLRTKYGYENVEDGNKAVKIQGNSYRMDADVLPCMAYRQYFKACNGEPSYHSGITFFTKSSERIINFPHQHFTNLTQKNQNTDGKVKGCIRILKCIRNEFEDAGKWDRKRSPSYYLEGLLWNVPDHLFWGAYDEVMCEVLKYLWNDLTEKKENGNLGEYAQANDILRLFHAKYWNVDDAIAFIELIWKAVYST